MLAAASLSSGKLFADDETSRLRVGLITDLHYADKAPAGTRHYRETLAKLEEAATQFEKDQPTFLVELGDFIDAADSVDVEQSYLKTINREFSAICKDRHYVLGNHCVDTLRKDEFLAGVEQENSYCSFDRGSFHFVIVDSCFRSDGEPYGRKNFQWTDANIPTAELEWLEADLKATDKKVVVFAHQRLDGGLLAGTPQGSRGAKSVAVRADPDHYPCRVRHGRGHATRHADGAVSRQRDGRL